MMITVFCNPFILRRQTCWLHSFATHKGVMFLHPTLNFWQSNYFRHRRRFDKNTTRRYGWIYANSPSSPATAGRCVFRFALHYISL